MARLMHWLFLFLGLISIPLSAANAQERTWGKIDNLSIEAGLSQSTVNAIVQDRKGFMWFGTQDGLNRYDG